MASRSTAPAQGATSPRWGAPALVLARLAVSLVALAALALFCLAVPARFSELSTACVPGHCALGQVITTSPPPPAHYAFVLVGGEVAFALIYLLMALLIFWRRSHTPMALFVAGMLACWGLTFPPTLTALTAPRWVIPVALARFAGAAAITLFFYIFPDGRFRPRAAWVLAVLWIGAQIPHYFWPGTLLDFFIWPPALLAVVSAGFLGVMVALQVWRYRRTSNATERRQTKWVVFGIVCALMGYAALLVVAALVPGMMVAGTAGYATLMLGEEAAVAILPLCIGIAILHDRLYDIDLLLNRALVYGTLTALLTALYFAVVVSLQPLAEALTHQAGRTGPLVVVLSTLAVAAAFHPLRVRLQRTIDRRFFRTRYDSARMLAEVAHMIHREVDLGTLTSQLLGVVSRAFEPAHVSLWLRPLREGTAEEREPARGRDTSD